VGREHEAFELLIKQKATMLIPAGQDGKSLCSAEEKASAGLLSFFSSPPSGPPHESAENAHSHHIRHNSESTSSLPTASNAEPISAPAHASKSRKDAKGSVGNSLEAEWRRHNAHLDLGSEQGESIRNSSSLSVYLSLTENLLDKSSKSTRKGGSKEAPACRVVVDVREFMSALPSFLHARGVDLVPGTLLVADYVLSTDICIERKSLADLLASLVSGRLHKQMEFMLRHYKRPVLLIEFSEDRPFCLQVKELT
jgi:hypothetical protein